MFDLKGFRKDRKLSQKQISEILGIGTSFISQIETGKDPMPGYVPEKLAAAFGREEIEKYQYESPYPAETERLRRNRYLSSGRTNSSKRAGNAGISETADPIDAMAARMDAEWIDRVLKAIERRDELALLQQKEYERQGTRIDELLSFLRGQS